MQTFCLIRGYGMKSGDLLWQRTVHVNPRRRNPPATIGVSRSSLRGCLSFQDGTNSAGARGVVLGRACDADCTLPCELVAA